MVDPMSLNAFDPKMSGTFAISFLIIIAIIILSMSLSILKIYDTDAQPLAKNGAVRLNCNLEFKVV
jgi:hypothetical protein